MAPGGLRGHRGGVKSLLFILLVSLTIVFCGCSLIRAPVHQTTSLFRSVEHGAGFRTQTNMLAILQSEVMREADNYATVVAHASDDLATKVGTPEAKMEALQWKLQQARAAYMDATGDNPTLNAVDMAVLASLSVEVVKDYWVGEKYGDAAQPLLEVHRKLEKEAWLVLNGVLTQAQQDELHQTLDDWNQKNPHLRYVAAVRLRDFAAILGKNALLGPGNRRNSLWDMLSVDPFAGLDPAVAEIAQSRLLVERITYFLERAPMLFSWQVELTTYQITAQPAVSQTLSNITGVSQSAEIFAKTAEQLPALVNDQREAAINQFFAGVANERSNILETLDSQNAKLQHLLPEVRETLVSAGNTATAMDGAIKSLDSFVRYVSPPDTNPPSPSASTNSKPFNILDYGKAATEIGGMAKDLNVLLASANQSATQLSALSETATGKAERVMDRAFRNGLILVAFLLIGSVVAGLVYRTLAARFFGPRVISPGPKS